jgi:hypothetical protein
LSRVYLLLRSRYLLAVESCLLNHCLATDVFSGSAIPVMSGHVTIWLLDGKCTSQFAVHLRLQLLSKHAVLK